MSSFHKKIFVLFLLQFIFLVVFVETTRPVIQFSLVKNRPSLSTFVIVRGGSTAIEEEDDDEEQETISSSILNHPDFAKLQSYRLQQQTLLQLRATFLSEALAQRGLPIPSLQDVATPEGDAPPQPIDWDCALATTKDPKSCLYSFDAEPNTKVVAPIDTDQWISLGALNRLRRTDPTKVEPMWHSQYAILESWFDPESEYSLLQHVGIQGFVLNALLQGIRLPIVFGLGMCMVAIVCMPLLEFGINRLLVSGLLWSKWPKWARFVHAALPLKLLLGQMAYKGVAKAFLLLVGIVKDRLVEIECLILEQNIPLTVGVPTITQRDLEEEAMDDDEEENDEEEDDDEEEDMESDEWDFDDDEDYE